MEVIAGFSSMVQAMLAEFKRRPFTWNILGEFWSDLKTYAVLTWTDVYLVVAVALALTALRFILAEFVFKPVGIACRFTQLDGTKFSESSWKLMFYIVAVAWEFYIVIFNYPQFITNMESCWEDWSIHMEVPADIYYLYIFECGFYIHAVFGTIYMDVWRRDSVAMIMHHVLTNTLIIFSLAVRYHRIGLVVLVLHDAADVLLEFTKLVICWKNRTKNPGMLLEGIIGGGFFSFALIWLMFRLYAYPKLVLYSCGAICKHMIPDGPFYLIFNLMLWMLFCLNIYWFYFIAMLIIRIATGQSGVEDTREEGLDVPEKKTVDGVPSKQQNGSSHAVMTNGHAHASSGQNGVRSRHATNGNANKH